MAISFFVKSLIIIFNQKLFFEKIDNEAKYINIIILDYNFIYNII